MMILKPICLSIFSIIICSCGVNDYHLRIENSQNNSVEDVVLESKNKTTRVSQIYPKAHWDNMFANKTFGSVPEKVQLQWRNVGEVNLKKEEVDLSSVPKNFKGVIVIKISDKLGVETIDRDVSGDSPSIWRIPF